MENAAWVDVPYSVTAFTFGLAVICAAVLLIALGPGRARVIGVLALVIIAASQVASAAYDHGSVDYQLGTGMVLTMLLDTALYVVLVLVPVFGTVLGLSILKKAAAERTVFQHQVCTPRPSGHNKRFEADAASSICCRRKSRSAAHAQHVRHRGCHGVSAGGERQDVRSGRPSCPACVHGRCVGVVSTSAGAGLGEWSSWRWLAASRVPSPYSPRFGCSHWGTRRPSGSPPPRTPCCCSH